MSGNQSMSSTVRIDKRYLYRLELENHLYQRHLRTFEVGVAEHLLALLDETFGEGQHDSMTLDQATTDQT